MGKEKRERKIQKVGNLQVLFMSVTFKKISMSVILSNLFVLCRRRYVCQIK